MINVFHGNEKSASFPKDLGLDPLSYAHLHSKGLAMPVVGLTTMMLLLSKDEDAHKGI